MPPSRTGKRPSQRVPQHPTQPRRGSGPEAPVGGDPIAGMNPRKLERAMRFLQHNTCVTLKVYVQLSMVSSKEGFLLVPCLEGATTVQDVLDVVRHEVPQCKASHLHTAEGEVLMPGDLMSSVVAHGATLMAMRERNAGAEMSRRASADFVAQRLGLDVNGLGAPPLSPTLSPLGSPGSLISTKNLARLAQRTESDQTPLDFDLCASVRRRSRFMTLHSGLNKAIEQHKAQKQAVKKVERLRREASRGGALSSLPERPENLASVLRNYRATSVPLLALQGAIGFLAFVDTARLTLVCKQWGALDVCWTGWESDDAPSDSSEDDPVPAVRKAPVKRVSTKSAKPKRSKAPGRRRKTASAAGSSSSTSGPAPARRRGAKVRVRKSS